MILSITPAMMLSRMIALAAEKHSGQFDKSGMPYILHPSTVAHKLKTTDLELMCIAWGHDLVEDTDVTYYDLKELGFSNRVIEGIRALTKVPGETQTEYRVKVMANLDATLVKMQDLRHNSDLRRLKGVTEKDITRTTRYMQFYKELEGKLNESQPSKG